MRYRIHLGERIHEARDPLVLKGRDKRREFESPYVAVAWEFAEVHPV